MQSDIQITNRNDTCFVDIDVVKYNSTARSRSSRPDTATILPLSLQENVRSPLS